MSSIEEYIEIWKKCKLLSMSQLTDLLKKSKEVLINEPNMVKVDAPVTVVGDIHGQFYDLMELFKISGDLPNVNYLFLGDYVDRGNNSIECFTLILALKVKYKERITILRGNHESCEINRIYGFYDECIKKYGNEKVWKMFVEIFMYLPISALIENKIFCLHGGLSPNLEKLRDIEKINRKIDIPHEGVMCDIFWSDPDENIKGFNPSPRAAGYIFGPDKTKEFLNRNGLSLISRAHQLVMDGFNKFHNNSVVTIFSAPNYCYRCGNKAAVMEVNENLETKYIQYSQAENTPESRLVRRPPDYFL